MGERSRDEVPDGGPSLDEGAGHLASSPGGRGQRSLRWFYKELPLFVGILVAWFLLFRWGRAFVLMPIPVGPDWNQYYMAAWKVMHRIAEDYPEFRDPLYPWLIGKLGATMGYVVASTILSSIGAFLMVVAAGLGARALSHPWAGALAALSVPYVATTTEASRWASQYTVLAAASGLALACGVCIVRWPRWGWALAAGIASGLAWGIDARGESMALVAGLLILLGMTGQGLGWRRFIFPVCFLLGFSLGPLSQRQLEVIPRRSTAYLVEVQRRMAMDDIRAARAPGVYEACAEGKPEKVPILEALTQPCARALFRKNIPEYSTELAFGLTLTLLFLPLVLLPGRRGWRGVLASGLYFGPPIVILMVVAGLIDVPARYVVQYASLLAGIVPVGLARTVRTIWPSRWRRRAHWAVGFACIVAALWLVYVGPSDRRLIRNLARYTQLQQVQGRLIAAIRQLAGPGDRLLDCSHNLRVEVAMLPFVLEPDPAGIRESPDDKRCRAYVMRPPAGEGARWLITDGHSYLSPQVTGRWTLIRAQKLPDHQGYLWKYTLESE